MATTIFDLGNLFLVRASNGTGKGTRIELNVPDSQAVLDEPRAVLDLASTLEEWAFAEIERREGFAVAKQVKEARRE